MHLVLHLVLACGFLIAGGNERGTDRLWATRKRENIARTGLGLTIMPSAPTGARPKHLVLHRVLARGILETPRNKRRGGPEGASRKRGGIKQATTNKRRGGPDGTTYKRRSKRRGEVGDNLRQ